MITIRQRLSIWCIGIFFIAIGVLGYFNAFHAGTPQQVLWLCYTGLIIMGVGALLRNSAVIESRLYLLAIPDLIWTVDFIVRASTGVPFLGITDYFFVPSSFLPKLVTLQHLVSIPLVLYVLAVLKLSTKPLWIVSAGQLIALFVISRLITEPALNINCVYRSCGVSLGVLPYPLEWFIGGFALIGVTAWLLARVPLFKRT